MSDLRSRLLAEKRLSEKANDSTEIEQLVCPRCQPVEAEIAQMREALQSMQQAHDEQAVEIAGLQIQLRRAGQAEVMLRRELANVREENPKAEVIRSILAHWVEATGRGKRGRKPKLAVSDKRGQIVAKALRLKNVNTGKHYTPEELLEAIDGMALLPFAGPRGRQRTDANGARRYDEVEHALGDEIRIDRNIEAARRAMAARDSESVYRAWCQAAAQEAMYSRLVLWCAGAAPEEIEARIASIEKHDDILDADPLLSAVAA